MPHGSPMNHARRAHVRLSCFDRAFPSHPHHHSLRWECYPSSQPSRFHSWIHSDLHIIDENAHNDDCKGPRIAQAPRNGTVRKRNNKGNETP